MIKAPNLLDEKRIFELSKGLKVQKVYLGERRSLALVVDNFYKRPELVRNLVFTAPATLCKTITGHSPGPRVSIGADLSAPTGFILDLVEKHFNRIFHDEKFASKSFFKSNFTGNLLNSDKKPTTKQRTPHWDSVPFAAVAYLNTPDEVKGGTGFYRHRKTGLEGMFTKRYATKQDVDQLLAVFKKFPKLKNYEALAKFVMKYPKHVKEFITDSNEDWELTNMIEMKYNRLVLYEGDLFHAVYFKKNWYKDLFRVTQTWFM